MTSVRALSSTSSSSPSVSHWRFSCAFRACLHLPFLSVIIVYNGLQSRGWQADGCVGQLLHRWLSERGREGAWDGVTWVCCSKYINQLCVSTPGAVELFCYLPLLPHKTAIFGSVISPISVRNKNAQVTVLFWSRSIYAMWKQRWFEYY